VKLKNSQPHSGPYDLRPSPQFRSSTATLSWQGRVKTSPQQPGVNQTGWPFETESSAFSAACGSPRRVPLAFSPVWSKRREGREAPALQTSASLREMSLISGRWNRPYGY